MKTILVTGSNGLLGQNVVKQLEKRQDVRIIASARGICRFNKEISTEYVTLDLTDEKSVERVFEEFNPKYVIHAAAMTNVDQCEQDKEGCLEANVNATRYIVENCKKYDSYLVNVSTDFVFDGINGPYIETDKPNPVSYYGWSKLEGEKLVSQSGIRASNVRTIIVYGVVDNMSRSNLVLWTKNSLEDKKDIRVINDQFRSPTWAGDLAWACIKLCDTEKEGIYHVSGEVTKSIVDWVREVVEFFDLDDSYITEVTSAELNQPAKRPLKTGFDISKAKKDLGYQPKSFKAGIRKMMTLMDAQKK